MTEKAKLLNVGFEVADSEQPKFVFDGDQAILTFVDWQEKEVTIRFENCVAFKWQVADSSGPEERDDSTYEIMNSEWLKSHLERNEIMPEEGHRHFKLCFNAVGVFEAIATRIDT